MTRRGWGIAALLAVTVAGTLFALRQPGGAAPSARSPGPAGWLAAREYLAARGAEITLLDQQIKGTLEAEDEPSVLVTGFPWSGGGAEVDVEGYLRYVEEGGTLLLAYSGGLPVGAEKRLLEALNLRAVGGQRRAPLGYGGWRAWQQESWELTAAPELAPQPGQSGGSRTGSTLASGARAPSLHAPRAVPEAPDNAIVLFRAPAGLAAGSEDPRIASEDSTRRAVVRALEEQGFLLTGALGDEGPVIFTIERGQGRILLLPADLFSNASLGEAGNADLLESLLAWLGPRWNFDEFAHGLHPPGERPSSIPLRVLDLFLLHLVILYLLALWHLARRFGPSWSEPPEHSGSAASLLLGLGALHRKLGHHRAAGALLLERIRELQGAAPGSPLSRDLSALEPAEGDDGLLRLAAQAAEARRAHGGGRHYT